MISQFRANLFDALPRSINPTTASGRKTRINSWELKSIVRRLPTLRGLYYLNDVPGGFEGLDVCDPKSHPEFALYAHNEAHIAKGIPIRNICPPCLQREHRRIIL